MIWISLSLQAIWFFLLYRWTKAAGRKIEQMQDNIAHLTASSVEDGKQLSDMWTAVQDLESVISDRDNRVSFGPPAVGSKFKMAKKPRRKK